MDNNSNCNNSNILLPIWYFLGFSRFFYMLFLLWWPQTPYQAIEFGGFTWILQVRKVKPSVRSSSFLCFA